LEQGWVVAIPYFNSNIDSKLITLDSYVNQKNNKETIFEDLTKSDLKNIIEEWQEYNS
jgi:hypothetical protein